jgi:L-lysine exporter family protein LysE/ArgO
MLAAGGSAEPLRTVLTQCVAFTWLNPHVYLDTVVLLGGLSATYADQRMAFGAGAAFASFAWFFGLAYGARLLQPVFARPAAWRVLDTLIGLVMLALALKIAMAPL